MSDPPSLARAKQPLPGPGISLLLWLPLKMPCLLCPHKPDSPLVPRCRLPSSHQPCPLPEVHLDVFLSCLPCWYSHHSTVFTSFSVTAEQVKPTTMVQLLLSGRHVFTGFSKNAYADQTLVFVVFVTITPKPVPYPADSNLSLKDSWATSGAPSKRQALSPFLVIPTQRCPQRSPQALVLRWQWLKSLVLCPIFSQNRTRLSGGNLEGIRSCRFAPGTTGLPVDSNTTTDLTGEITMHHNFLSFYVTWWFRKQLIQVQK